MIKLAVVACVLLLAGLAAAQSPVSGNIFVGYSYYNTDLIPFERTGMQGWQGALEGRILPHVSIVADLGGHYGSKDFIPPGIVCPISGCVPVHANMHIYDAMFGPRFFSDFGRVRVFQEFEVGVSHLTSETLGSSTGVSGAIGGGVDFRIVRPIAWRGQVDFVWTHLTGTTQSVFRVATGPVFRF
jgi:hypothetical protein